MAAENCTAELPDDRDLAWIELGIPDGAPVRAFHDSPGIGYSVHEHAAHAESAGVRLIAPLLMSPTHNVSPLRTLEPLLWSSPVIAGRNGCRRVVDAGLER